MKITILPFGSRGDVQPYIALAVGLKRAGHDVIVPVSPIFQELIIDAGLEYYENTTPGPQEVTQNPEVQAEVSKGSQLRGLFAVLRQAGPMIEALLDNCWQYSQDADAVIASLIPWGALDSAEKLGIPAIRAPLHSLYPTRAFPSPFLSPGKTRFNHPFNPLSNHLLRMITWRFLRRPVNKWRRERLDLPPLPFSGVFKRMDAQRIPVIYPFSTHVLPRPADYPEWHHIAGYWFLDNPADWQPPNDLTRFLEAGPPPVFIGFGSMEGQEPEYITDIVVKALQISGQRGILQSGWLGLGEIDLPEDVLKVGSLLHSWLFPRMAVVIHHGGAGTTAAGLRSGVPSIITPVLGDQFFWAQRIQQLGVGLSPASFFKLTPELLAEAITTTVNDQEMQARAARLGEQIRSENGVERTVDLIEQIVARNS